MNIKNDVQGFDLSGYSACVIGCGGLGTNAAVHLVGSGIGRLYLCDYDKIEKSNLNRQFLYTEKDIGKKKADVISKRLAEYCDDKTEIFTVCKKISSEDDLDFSLDCDIIISCVDNEETRLIAESFSKEHSIPLVEGGIDGFYGFSYLYLPFKCIPPSETGLIKEGAAKKSVSPVAGIIGSTQASLAVRYLITKDESLSGKLLIFDEYKFDTLTLNNNQR